MRDIRSVVALRWRRFASRHRRIAQFLTFYAFSLLVTLLQYLMLTFCRRSSISSRIGVRYLLSLGIFILALWIPMCSITR